MKAERHFGLRPGGSAARTSPGLTLLEVILAVSLTVLLVGAAYAMYELTLHVRADAREEGQVVFAQRRVMDLLARELQSAIVYPMFMMGMQGRSDELTFLRTAVPSRAVYLVDEAFSASPDRQGSSELRGADWEPEHDIQMVTYRLYRYEDEDGAEQIGGLERTCLRTIGAQAVEEPVEPSEAADTSDQMAAIGSSVSISLLTAHIKFLYVQYWDGAAWAEQWNEPALPSAVRIELGIEPLPEDTPPEEYPYETVWRVVAIPTGYTQPEGTVIRASGGAGFGGRGRNR